MSTRQSRRDRPEACCSFWIKGSIFRKLRERACSVILLRIETSAKFASKLLNDSRAPLLQSMFALPFHFCDLSPATACHEVQHKKLPVFRVKISHDLPEIELSDAGIWLTRE